VLPEQDAVVVITSGVKDMQVVLNLVWAKLLPALRYGSLPPDKAAAEKLQQKLKSLTVPTVKGSTGAVKVAGKKYVFPENKLKLEAITLEADGAEGAATLVASFDGVEQRIACGAGEWNKDRLAWGRFPEQPVAASGGWTDGDTYTAKLCFYETPFIVTLRLQFVEDELRFDTSTNVGFGSTKEPQLVGEAD
jgi:hypothetical protein